MKQHKNIVVAQAPHVKSQQHRTPVAPPVYRPQPLPAVLQRKIANPSAYQPVQAQRVLQPKIAQTKWQHIGQGIPSVVQLAEEKKLSFKEVLKLVSGNGPERGEQRQTYIDRVVALAGGIEAGTRAKVQNEAGKAWDQANPKPAEKKKKAPAAGPHPGWVVDADRSVFKGYDFGSGGGSHRPKGMVWIDDDGNAWAEDKDEHAGAGYKKFVPHANKWRYAGSYDMTLKYKNR